MTILAIVIAVAVVLVVVLVVAMVVPQRIATQDSSRPGTDVDDESEAYRDRAPGGGTGGI